MKNQDFIAHGGLVLNNFGGIQIELSSCGESVRYRYNYGDDNSISEIFEAEIEYFCNGEEDEQYCAAFRAGKGDNESIYFLDEFIRIDHAKNF
jgi:hypothetical protein